MIHLICLRCNRANASEAKFCSECGAGLLRKFCGRCHAINDAESLFCQSCGEALPAQPSAPQAPPMKPPAVVPDLTDVYADGDQPEPAPAAAQPDSRWHDEPTAVVPVVSAAPPPSVPVAVRASQRTVLFGFVGGAAVLLAVLLWSRGEHPHATPVDTPAATTPPAVVAPVPAAPVVALPAAVPQPQPVTVPDHPARSDTAGSAIATAQPQPAKEPSKVIERRLAPEAQIAAQPPAAGPPRSAAAERKPVVRSTSPTAPPLDCTPQVDALGLCAPGAKVADRSGSR